MLGLALAHRSFSAARSALPVVSSISRWSIRHSSTKFPQDGEPGQQLDIRKEGDDQAALEPKLFGASIYTSKTTLDPSQLPLPNTPDISQGLFSEETYAASYVPGRSIHLPFLHPRTHSIPVAAIHFRSYHTELLELFTHFASHAATALGIPISRVVKLPTQRSLWTVPKSPFVHKKSQENFERKLHKRLIKAWDADQEVVERWVKYLRKHEMGGVGMRIVRWERTPLGIGRKKLEGVTSQLGTREEAKGGKTVEAEIKKFGENILNSQSSQ